MSDTLKELIDRQMAHSKAWSDNWFEERDGRTPKALEELDDLEYRHPDCPACLDEVNSEAGDYLYCDTCRVRWSIDGTGPEYYEDDE